MFGPLPVSDKEFVVGRMDFQSLPTWTDSLVQYLKQDPTYFVTQAKLDAEETRRREDLAVVKDVAKDNNAEPPKQARYFCYSEICLLLWQSPCCSFQRMLVMPTRDESGSLHVSLPWATSYGQELTLPTGPSLQSPESSSGPATEQFTLAQRLPAAPPRESCIPKLCNSTKTIEL